MTHTSLIHHLLQSTLCVFIAWALTLALRNNRAAVRYWIWLGASLKFLVPLSLLVSLGAQFGVRTATSGAQPQLSVIVSQISAPVGLAPMTAMPVSAAPDRLPAVLFGLWLCGAATVLLGWFRSWRNIRALRRAATPLNLSLPIPVMSSAARLEPGVFGVFRPVLLLPEGIASRLTQHQLETVFAHELCHVRRRDNLTAVLHMLVETIFWFHPLVWWIGSRLADERERACDEAVLQTAGEPEVYAEGILQVCRLYLKSPIACMSGISGADLRARIQRIMSGARIHNISFGRKLLLATVALAVAGLPLLIGVLTPRLRAQSQVSTQSWTRPASASAFEVASIKPASPKALEVGLSTHPGGRLTIRNLSLWQIVNQAFELKPLRLKNAEGSVFSARYDIDAKAEGNPTRPQTMAMLRTLLCDRFRLKFHRETKVMPIYELIIAKNGPKLEKSTTSEFQVRLHRIPSADGSGMSYLLTAQKISMEKFCDFLINSDRLVFNRTGIQGEFDLKLNYAYEDNPDAPSLFTAIQTQLGLQLQPAKGPVEYFVMDHAEKPSEN
jgi:bla regulator protein blaR1